MVRLIYMVAHCFSNYLTGEDIHRESGKHATLRGKKAVSRNWSWDRNMLKLLVIYLNFPYLFRYGSFSSLHIIADFKMSH